MIPIVENNGCVHFLLEWVGDDFETSANFIVHEVVSWEMDGTASNTEKYLSGYIKWDGCSHFWFGDRDGYMHLCGRESIDHHIAVMNAVWEECDKKIEME